MPSQLNNSAINSEKFQDLVNQNQSLQETINKMKLANLAKQQEYEKNLTMLRKLNL